MKHLLLALIVGAGILSLPACTKEQSKDVLCSAGKTASALVSSQISNELSCSNPTAVRESIEEQLVKLKICEKKADTEVAAKGAIGTAICAPVIDAIFTGAVSTLPGKWGCTGGTLTADSKAKLIASCSKAF